MAHLVGGDFRQEVVGESHYTRALARCFKAGDVDDSGKRSYISVELVAENNNKHDKNAVAVVGKFGVVGYLSRDDAKIYRKLYSTETHTTDAVIVTRDGDLFGVWLNVLLDDDELDDYEDEDLENFVKAQRKFKPTSSRTKPKQPDIISILARWCLWFVGICFVLGIILGMIMS